MKIVNSPRILLQSLIYEHLILPQSIDFNVLYEQPTQKYTEVKITDLIPITTKCFSVETWKLHMH